MIKNLIFIVVIAMLGIISCTQPVVENANWRGPDRTGFYPETGLLTEWPEKGPDLVWKYDSLGIGYSTAAVTEKGVYITGTHDSTSYIYAFDHEGNLKWEKPFGLEWNKNYPGVRSTPVISDGLGYVVTGRGKMVCFDTETGDFKWTKDWIAEYNGVTPYFGFCENFLIDGDKVFCTPGDTLRYNILALNKNTGELIWESQGVNEISAYASPTIITHNGIRMLVTFTSNSIVALNPENGNMLWSHKEDYKWAIHANIPIYEGGFIFGMNGWEHGSFMLKLNDDATAAEEVWRSDLFDLEHGDIMKIGDRLYGSSWQKKVFSVVDWNTGEVKDSNLSIAPASVIVAEGLIYAYEYNGKVHLVKPTENSFEIISTFNAPGRRKDHIAHPVIHNKRLYIRYNKELLVYDIARS